MKQNGDKHFLCLNNEQTDLEEVLGVANTAEGPKEPARMERKKNGHTALYRSSQLH